jgi:hypothetical protein
MDKMMMMVMIGRMYISYDFCCNEDQVEIFCVVLSLPCVLLLIFCQPFISIP